MNTCSLQSTLEGMIIRHRNVDVERDVELPPLHQKIVCLDGSLQDKLSLNLFSLVIVSNAVTSERKDADYLFHYKQRKALDQLVANLRQASFFWSGIQISDVEFTLNFSKTFLDKREVYTTEDDRDLLRRVVDVGSMALSNPIWLAASKYHEMPLYVENKFTVDARAAWALDSKDQNPTLLGASQLLSLQIFVNTRLANHRGLGGLESAGKKAMETALVSSPPATRYKSNAMKMQRKLDEDLRTPARVPEVGEGLNPRKKQKKAVEANGSVPDPETLRQGSFFGFVSVSAQMSPSLPASIPEPISIPQVKVLQGGHGVVASSPSHPVAENLVSDGLISLNETLLPRIPSSQISAR
jgi:hypothetical protein